MTASEADAAARNAAARTRSSTCLHQWSAWGHRGAAHGYVRRDCRCGAFETRAYGVTASEADAAALPAVELQAAGMPVTAERPWYRTWGRCSRGSHSVVVGLYREP